MCTLNAIVDLADHINWRDPNYRRRIAACLVHVVKLLQQDNGKTKKKSMVDEESSEKWCMELKFHVEKEIKENEVIFGAIFKRDRAGKNEPPLEVIAFRGTLLDKENTLKDMRHNWKVATACHGKNGRVHIGLEDVRSSIGRPGARDTWIVGHSLGAATAIAIARNLGKEERKKIEAHLFNLPFISPRLPEVIIYEKVGKALEFVRDILPPLGLLDRPMIHDEKLRGLYNYFIGLRDWIPNIYVSDNDPICCSYIRYFKVMKAIYTQGSDDLYEYMKHFFCYEIAKKKTPWHLVPSAKLFVNQTKDHGLSQWWSTRLELEETECVLRLKPKSIEGNAAPSTRVK